MKIFHSELTVNTQTDAAIAESMFRFWVYQYEKATFEYNLAKGKLADALDRNKNYKEPDENNGFSYFTPPQPYSHHQIQDLQNDVTNTEKQYNESKAMYSYFVRYIFNKAHSS